MFKKLIFITCMLFIIGCNKPTDLATIYNPITGFETGVWQVAFIVEQQSNFSSLLYDKTEEKFETFNVRPINIIPAGSTFFVFSTVKADKYNRQYIDDTHCSVMENYLRINNYGNITKNPDEADFIILIDVAESVYFNSKNTSNISVTIMDPDESPVFFVQAKVVSDSDRNFYYRPSKSAKPASYLTLKGFEKIFREAMPQAFS